MLAGKYFGHHDDNQHGRDFKKVQEDMTSIVLAYVIRTQMNIALAKLPIFWILQHHQA